MRNHQGGADAEEGENGEKGVRSCSKAWHCQERGCGSPGMLRLKIEFFKDVSPQNITQRLQDEERSEDAVCRG